MRDKAHSGVGLEEGQNVIAGHEDAALAVASGGQYQRRSQVGPVVIDEGRLGVVGEQAVEDAALIRHPGPERAVVGT